MWSPSATWKKPILELLLEAQICRYDPMCSKTQKDVWVLSVSEPWTFDASCRVVVLLGSLFQLVPRPVSQLCPVSVSLTEGHQCEPMTSDRKAVHPDLPVSWSWCQPLSLIDPRLVRHQKNFQWSLVRQYVALTTQPVPKSMWRQWWQVLDQALLGWWKTEEVCQMFRMSRFSFLWDAVFRITPNLPAQLAQAFVPKHEISIASKNCYHISARPASPWTQLQAAISVSTFQEKICLTEATEWQICVGAIVGVASEAG